MSSTMNDDENVDDWDGLVQYGREFKADEEDDENSYAESDSDEKLDDNQTNLKKEKKKRKFEELKKAVKLSKSKLAHDDAPSSSSRPTFFDSLKADSTLHQSVEPSDFIEISDSLDANIKCDIVKAILSVLPRFKKMIKNRSASSEVKGCPLIVIVTLSAIRATEIVKSVSKHLHVKIAKLFAKHIKIQKQIDDLNEYMYPVAIGTPARLNKLIELGALHLSKTRGVIIDGSHKDQKEFSLTTLPGVSEDFSTLIERSVQPELGHLKLCYV